ncbi:amidase [Halobacteriales archaeon QS_3_64_16]|nr:MAG: amidase [Halobacteriales archaeon QS_3_64_16]
MTDLPFRSASEQVAEMRAGEYSPVDLLEAHLDRIDTRNDRTNAFVTIVQEDARAAAREAEAAIENDEQVGPLHGVPVAIKDLVPTADVRTTFGSKAFAEFVPEESAILLERLREAGAIVIGKTNTPEFGHKGTTDNPLFGPTHTPYAPGRTAGGSSGGSAAAVADGLAALAQGSDGGGSLRIPAACCGVVGLMPSFGRVPVENRPDGIHHTPFSQNGPLARTVEDAARMLEVMADPHPRDPLCLPDDGTDFPGAVDRGIEDLAIAYSDDLGVFTVRSDVREIVDSAVDALAGAGADVAASDPEFEHSREAMLDAWRTGFRVGLAATNAGFRREMGIDLVGEYRVETTPELVEHIEAGENTGALGYKRADTVRTAVFDAIQDTFAEYDLLVTPTIALPPFDSAILGPTEIEGESIDPLYGWFLTWIFNMTGHPAASVPAGKSEEGLPVGLQIVGPRFREDRVLAAAAAFERAQPWQDDYPR